MRICDVVLNSIWFDPRVRKQIIEYNEPGNQLLCVGLKCFKYDEEKVSQIPCEAYFAEIPQNYAGRLGSVLKKLKRKRIIEDQVTEKIINFKPDIIHANDLDALIPSYRAAKKLKCKLIYDSHEVYTENNHIASKKLYSFYLKLIEKHIVKRVDKMICVSNAAAEYFSKIYKIEKPTVVTNCCLKKEMVEVTKKNVGFEILNHGQFYDGRGYDVMLESAPLLKEIPEIKLAIRGFGYLEESLRKRAEELNAENFIFYPPVTVDKLIESASHSMVGVAITEPICLNFKLSVSNKIFEYAAAGLPVIMSDIPEHRYLNEKYNFGIILKENTPEFFAEAVKKLYSDKDFYNECAKNARLLSDEVNWENEFGKLIAVEKELCG